MPPLPGPRVLSLVAACALLSGPRPARDTYPADAHRGVCWVGGAHEPSLVHLKKLGVEWISVSPFAYGQREKDRPPPGGYQWSRRGGESVDGVRAVVRAARAAGLKVMLKPHVWYSRGGDWVGSIAMRTPEDWEAWFHAYGTFLIPFVDLAREEKVEIFCVGTELSGTTIGRPDLWSGMIGEIRKRYSGPLTYAANWDREFEDIAFWKDLDWVGVQGYFPLSDKDHPSDEDLAAGWQRWVERMGAITKKTGRKILFTEFGYKPVVGTASRPWEWRSQAPFSAEAQAKAYEAFFAAVSGREWFAGAYVWKWFAGYEGGGLRRRQDFSPQGLLAEGVMARWFRGARLAEDAESRPDPRR